MPGNGDLTSKEREATGLTQDNTPVSSYQQVVENVKRFNAAIDAEESVIKRLSSFHHWYYIPEIDMFGPSKFIGYQGMDSEFYMTGHGIKGIRRRKNGGETEEVLSEWFAVLFTDDKKWPVLEEKLARQFPRNKKPRKNHTINVPRD